jgi:oligopeptide transport system substrate-binding protein
MMVGLTTLDPAARPIPGMAQSWSVSKDGLTWTFTLRKALWSDGRPVTAGDFDFAFHRLLDPRTASRSAANLWILKNARAVSQGRMPAAALGVSAPRPGMLVLRLEHPAPYLPELLAHESADPLPRHVLEAKGAGWTRPGNYVANGPYLLKEWVPGDHVTLVKNPRFYDAARVHIDAVRYIPTSDSDAALRRFRAGELDMQTPAPLAQLPWMRANLKGELHILPSLALSYIAFNLDYPPLKDLRVRRAMNLAYNREAVVDQVLKLGETPAYSYVPPGVANSPGGAALDFKAKPFAARIAEAQSLMRAAGYGPGNRLRLTYMTSTNPDSRRLAALFQAMMKPVFIDIDIQAMDLQIVLRNLRQHQFQLGAANWFADFNDASNFLDLLQSAASNNYAHYRDPRFDAALDSAQSETDAKARGQKLLAAERLALAGLPWLVTRFNAQTELVQPYVKGYVPNLRDYNRTRWLWLAK